MFEVYQFAQQVSTNETTLDYLQQEFLALKQEIARTLQNSYMTPPKMERPVRVPPRGQGWSYSTRGVL